MVKRLSVQEARSRFADVIGTAHYGKEPVIIEKQGRPMVAVISIAELEELQHLRREARLLRFASLTRELGLAALELGLTADEEEIAKQGDTVREQLFQERYGKPPSA